MKGRQDVKDVQPDVPSELPVARRLAPEFPERWTATGVFIWDGQREIGTMKSERLAQFVCACHNCFLWLLNRAIWLSRRLQDVKSMEDFR